MYSSQPFAPGAAGLAPHPVADPMQTAIVAVPGPAVCGPVAGVTAAAALEAVHVICRQGEAGHVAGAGVGAVVAPGAAFGNVETCSGRRDGE